MDPTTSHIPHDALPEDLAVRISARLDGELSPVESEEIDRVLADNPVARRFADDLRGLSGLCRSVSAPPAGPDLSSVVVAEALRRQAEAAESMRPLPASLEPEGAFGLPFGRSSQNWAWAGVAAAAAMVMFLAGRSDRPGPPTARPSLYAQQAAAKQQALAQQQALARLRQADPRLHVVDYQVTPDRLQQLRGWLARRASRPAELPGDLMTVSQQTGVRLQPADPKRLIPEGVTEEVLAVDVDEAQLDRLLEEFDREQGGSVKLLEPERPAPAAPVASAPPRGLPIGGLWRVQLAPGAKPGAPPSARVSLPAGKRLVVLRIRVTPKP